jgi:hypothetical protein
VLQQPTRKEKPKVKLSTLDAGLREPFDRKVLLAFPGLNHGDEFEIKLGRKQIQLILLGTAEEK